MKIIEGGAQQFASVLSSNLRARISISRRFFERMLRDAGIEEREPDVFLGDGVSVNE